MTDGTEDSKDTAWYKNIDVEALGMAGEVW